MDLTKLFLAFSLIGGQWILYILVGLSLFSIALIIERAIYFRKNRRDGEYFEPKLLLLLKAGKIEEAVRMALTATGSEARCIQHLYGPGDSGEPVEPAGEEMDRIEQRLLHQVAIEQVRMEKGLLILGTLGNNAPFIGLLGTVLGIIKAFYDLSVTGSGGPSVVMLGIAEALIATALGLFVAIPAVIAYNLFQRQVRLTRQKLDQFATTALLSIRAHHKGIK